MWNQLDWRLQWHQQMYACTWRSILLVCMWREDFSNSKVDGGSSVLVKCWGHCYELTNQMKVKYLHLGDPNAYSNAFNSSTWNNTAILLFIMCIITIWVIHNCYLDYLQLISKTYLQFNIYSDTIELSWCAKSIHMLHIHWWVFRLSNTSVTPVKSHNRSPSKKLWSEPQGFQQRQKMIWILSNKSLLL